MIRRAGIGHAAALAVAVVLAAGTVAAQTRDGEARAVVWRAYEVPSTPYERFVNEAGELLLRVPAGWEHSEGRLGFAGPNGSELSVFVETIPDGIPIKSYVTSFLRRLRDVPGGSSALVVRRTEIAGFEGREVVIEMQGAGDAMERRSAWIFVSGPRAVTLVFKTRVAGAGELEALFKGVVQSVVFSRDTQQRGRFEALRKGAVGESSAARVDDVQGLANALASADAAGRESAKTRLVAMFAAAPASAVDLLLDPRPLVRAGAIEGLARSRNAKLTPLLAYTLDDEDAFVAARAARAIAVRPDAVALIEGESADFGRLLRTFDYLSRDDRVCLVDALLTPERKPPLPPPAPPPPAKSVPPPVAEAPPAEEPPSGAFGGVVVGRLLTESREAMALELLRRVPPAEYPVPFGRIVRLVDDELTALAIEVALDRREQLSPDDLLGHLSSKSERVRHLAARALGASGRPSDMPALEARAREAPSDPGSKVDAELARELEGAVRRIRLRERVTAATGAERDAIVVSAMADASTAAWAWEERGTTSPGDEAGALRAVLPLGENVYPAEVGLYASIPSPGALVGRFDAALAGIHLGSARDQANFLLFLNAIREQARGAAGMKANQPRDDAIGIDLGRPMAIGSWTAKGALRGLESARRVVAVLPVRDREQLERQLAAYERRGGGFDKMPEVASALIQIVGLAPAILPTGAVAALSGARSGKRDLVGPDFTWVGSAEVAGIPVTVFGRRVGTYDARVTGEAVYSVYLGDVALLAPDLESLADALGRLRDGGTSLASNPHFVKAAAAGGDAIYLGNLREASAVPGREDYPNVVETGSLSVSSTTWENSYRLAVDETTWMKPLLPIVPREAKAPAELLPKSTVFYGLARVDMAAAWAAWARPLVGQASVSALESDWQVNFKKDVLPELGPECGFGLLGVPKLASASTFDAPVVVFFKLKSDKLARKFAQGKLFKPLPETPHNTMRVMVKNGYLVFADSNETLELLDSTERLASARDFVRTLERTPANTIAFGGYNLDAALDGVAAIAHANGDDTVQSTLDFLGSIVRAFHSQSFYATARPDGIEARLSVSLDRESRFSVEDLAAVSTGFRNTFAVIEPRGVPITGQERIERLEMRIKVEGTSALDGIARDFTSDAQQVVSRESGLVVAVLPRRPPVEVDAKRTKAVHLPIADPKLASFLEPTNDIRSDDESVKKQAREIAGDDKDALAVAYKLADWTYKNLTWKRVDSADAVQTLATREADCQEFSELYVAMARSLGLPARIVSGLAHSDGSFGGHAWVEVYVDRWIELDPTWGTHSVDATHVRLGSGELFSYAVLGLVDIEVTDVKRRVLEAQRDPSKLVDALCAELPAGKGEVLTASLDATALAEAAVGAGGWSSIDGEGRERFAAASRRAVAAIMREFASSGSDETAAPSLRVLQAKTDGERVDSLVLAVDEYGTESLYTLVIERHGDVWTLADVIADDLGISLVGEALAPVLDAVRARRESKDIPQRFVSPRMQVLNVLYSDVGAGLRVAEEALGAASGDVVLRYLRAECLSQLDRADEAVPVWTVLASGRTPFAPALRSLAIHYDDEGETEKAIEFYRRYLAVVPEDPRGHSALGALLRDQGDREGARAEFERAVASDPGEPARHRDLAECLLLQGQYAAANAALDEAVRRGGHMDEMVGAIMDDFYYGEEPKAADGFAAARPELFAKDVYASIQLARIRCDAGRARDALPVLARCAELEPENPEVWCATATARRALRDWLGTVAAADKTIELDEADPTAHYNRACALARLGKRPEAIAALKRAIELDDSFGIDIASEPDFRALLRLPEFKALATAAE